MTLAGNAGGGEDSPVTPMPVEPAPSAGVDVAATAAVAAAKPLVSVIIPTWNEGERLAAAIAAAGGPGVELIVADGGSADDTVVVARQLGARVVHSPRGRGRQMAAGAAVARGEALLFLHADSRLPPGFVGHLRSVLADPATAVGAFRLRIDGRGLGLRWIEWCVALRCRWFRMPYGDQALFLRADTYEALGGFHDLVAMEDFDFVRRARRRGGVVVCDAAVVTSARAWQRHGVLRLTMLNAACAFACCLGVSPQRVARWRVRRGLAPPPHTEGLDRSPSPG